jgi:hypothetical protein
MPITAHSYGVCWRITEKIDQDVSTSRFLDGSAKSRLVLHGEGRSATATATLRATNDPLLGSSGRCRHECAWQNQRAGAHPMSRDLIRDVADFNTYPPLRLKTGADPPAKSWNCGLNVRGAGLYQRFP